MRDEDDLIGASPDSFKVGRVGAAPLRRCDYRPGGYESHTGHLCSSDAVERGLVGRNRLRSERKGLRLVAGELPSDRTRPSPVSDDEEQRERPAPPHAAGQRSNSSHGRRRSSASSKDPRTPGRSCAASSGVTNPAEAAPGTIRGDYGAHDDRKRDARFRWPRIGPARDRAVFPGRFAKVTSTTASAKGRWSSGDTRSK